MTGQIRANAAVVVGGGGGVVVVVVVERGGVVVVVDGVVERWRKVAEARGWRRRVVGKGET